MRATLTLGSTLLSPKDHTLIMIDIHSQMLFATKSKFQPGGRHGCKLSGTPCDLEKIGRFGDTGHPPSA